MLFCAVLVFSMSIVLCEHPCTISSPERKACLYLVCTCSEVTMDVSRPLPLLEVSFNRL